MNTQQVLAFLVVGGVLVVAADFESTAQLSEALAVLIMVGVFYKFGPDAISNVRKMTGTDTTPGAARGGPQGHGK
jgi:hypothetical protein